MLKLSVLNRQHDRRNYWQVKPKKVRLKKSTKPANSLHALSLEGILMAFGCFWDACRKAALFRPGGTFIKAQDLCADQVQGLGWTKAESLTSPSRLNCVVRFLQLDSRGLQRFAFQLFKWFPGIMLVSWWCFIPYIHTYIQYIYTYYKYIYTYTHIINTYIHIINTYIIYIL